MEINDILINAYVWHRERTSNWGLKYDGVTVERNVRYGERKNQTFSLYRKSERVLPLVINFHGGGVAGRNKNGRRAFCVSLAKRDVAVMNVEYRGETELGALDCLQQVEKIFQYVKENHKAKAINPDKVFLCGDDVGAYIASMLAVRAESYGIRVLGVMGFSGLYDVVGHAKETQRYSTQYHLLKKFFKVDLKQTPEREAIQKLSALSVTHNLSAEYPPVFIVHSMHDEFAPSQGDLMRLALAEHGVNCWEFKAVHERAYHNFHLSRKTKPAEAVDYYLTSFLDEALSGGIYRNEYREI